MMRAEELERIEGTVRTVLREQDCRLDRVTEEGSPISTILTVKNQKVGFAELAGHPESDYHSTLESFRKIYSVHAGEWAKFDLTLVLCRQRVGQPSDEICNKIEIDPYFCRKFIIDLAGDLEAELRRLPFVPLSTQTVSIYKTPTDARTFLIGHGMSPDLAKYLVVPGNRGVERIVDDSLEGKVGNPAWRDIGVEAFGHFEQKKGKRVRLKELEIKNFRAYREKRTFDLDANLVVLFGPNGLGKTSFFDALDFACTGSVARFEERFRSNSERLRRALRHLDSLDVDCLVRVTVSSDGSSEEVVRTTADRLSANINGSPADRTKTIMKFAGLSGKPPGTHIDHLIHLFRASHLFGQEFQSLTSGFRKDSVLPHEVISRMLAFQDYVEGINKTRRVIDEFKKRSQELSSRIQEFEKIKQQKEADIEFLASSVAQLDNMDSISLMGTALAERTSKLLGPGIIDIPKEITKESVRYWTALVGAQIHSCEEDIGLFRELEVKLSKLHDFQKTLEDDKTALASKKESEDQAEGNLKKQWDDLTVVTNRLEQERSEARDVIVRRENFNWLLGAKKRYEECNKTLLDVESRNARSREELAKSVQQLLSLDLEKTVAEHVIEEVKRQLDSLRKLGKELDSLQSNIGDWLQLTQSAPSIITERNSLEEEQKNVSATLRETENELSGVKNELDRWETHLKDIEKQRSEFEALLDSIERHITHEACPVCGYSYESKEELLRRLEMQRGTQPKEISEALQALQERRLRKTQLDDLLVSLSGRLLELKTAFEQRCETAEVVEKKLMDYAKRAELIGMPATPSMFTDLVEEKRVTNQRETEEKQNQLAEKESVLAAIGKRIDDQKQIEAGLKQEMQLIESTRRESTETIEGLRYEANNRSVFLDTEEAAVIKEIEECTRRISALQESMVIDGLKCREIKDEVNRLDIQKKALSVDIQSRDARLSQFRNLNEEAEHLSRRLNLDQVVDSVIAAGKTKLENKRLEAATTQKDLVNYEIVLDSAATSPLVAKARGDVLSTMNEIVALQGKNASIVTWNAYYESVIGELEALQRQSLDMYTKTYGPLTRNIQRRLRSVYGFGDIRLEPAEEGIAVRVERKGEKDIAPTDYFSESQIQIVMLGLFLSAALTQTWSSFNPILMDDPVEHFDNLNSYSLVDLIKGLIENDDNIQFIVSTCDERLFRLIQQRFHDRDTRTIFHIFESIGDDGPHFTTKYSSLKEG